MICIIPIILVLLFFSVMFYDECAFLRGFAWVIVFIIVSFIVLFTSPFKCSGVIVENKYIFYTKNPFKTLYLFLKLKFLKKRNTQLVVCTDLFTNKVLKDIKNNTCKLKVIKV